MPRGPTMVTGPDRRRSLCACTADSRPRLAPPIIPAAAGLAGWWSIDDTGFLANMTNVQDPNAPQRFVPQIGRASCRERVWNSGLLRSVEQREGKTKE